LISWLHKLTNISTVSITSNEKNGQLVRQEKKCFLKGKEQFRTLKQKKLFSFQIPNFFPSEITFSRG
jgi:hypothetical protein